MNWEKCLEIAREFKSEYALNEESQKVIFDLAMKLPNNAVIFEVGVANAKTTAVLLCSVKETGALYYGVDNFSLTKNEKEIREKLDKLKIPYIVFTNDSRTLGFDKEIDLLLIDGGHDEANVSKDCEQYLPLVKDGGIAIFDDYIPKPLDAGAHWAVREYADKFTKGWEDVGFFCGRVKIFRKPLHKVNLDFVNEAIEISVKHQMRHDAMISTTKREIKKRASEWVKGKVLDVGGEGFYKEDFEDVVQLNLPDDMHKMIYCDEFDGVVAMHVLEHSPFPFYVLLLIKRALKKGGKFYLAVPHPSEFVEKLVNCHYSVLMPNMWHKLLIEAGFKIEKRETGLFNDYKDATEERFFCVKP